MKLTGRAAENYLTLNKGGIEVDPAHINDFAVNHVTTSPGNGPPDVFDYAEETGALVVLSFRGGLWAVWTGEMYKTILGLDDYEAHTLLGIAELIYRYWLEDQDLS